MRALVSALIIFTVLSLPGCGGTALDERFHDRRLMGWTVIDDLDTIEGPSEWKVEEDGRLHQHSNIWGRRGDFLGLWYGTTIVAGDEEWTDYVMSVKAKPQDNDGFGVVFRFTDREHFYRLLFIEDGMNGGPLTRLDKRAGADYIELWSLRQGYNTGRETRIEVTVLGSRIQGAVDGRQLFEVNDSSFPRGKIGLFCYAQNGQAFDDVKVGLKPRLF
jgi:hypothetical protein